MREQPAAGLLLTRASSAHGACLGTHWWFRLTETAERRSCEWDTVLRD